MIVETDPATIEHRKLIDVPPADVFAFLSDPETIPEYWPGTTVTASDDSFEVAYTVAAGSSDASITLPAELRVIEVKEPTALTMRLDGAIYGTVEWTLQPQDGSTLVTATMTLTLDSQDLDVIDDAVDEPNRAGDQPLASVEATVGSTLDEALDILQTRCERCPPPASMANFELPDVYCPFPAEINPHFDEVAGRSVDWAREMDLLDEEDVPPGTMAALRFAGRVHPTAPREAFRLLGDWYCWGFLEDDNRDESGLSEHPRAMVEYQRPLLAVLEGEEPDHRTPLVRAFADLHRRWTEMGTPGWQKRIRRHHAEYFAAHRWEARNRSRNHVPVRADYVRNKRVAAGLYIVFDLAALAGDVDRPPSLYRSPIYQDLLEAVANVVCWTNDVYSLRKELAHDDVNNLIVVVRSEQDCSLRTAVAEVRELIAAETRRFEELRQRITREFDATDDLPLHLTQLETALGGHLKYSEEVARYATRD